MIHTQGTNILQPTIDRIKASEPYPNISDLFTLAHDLVQGQTSRYTYAPVYSEVEQVEAAALLRRHGFGEFCNLSQRCKRETLRKIEGAKVDLKLNVGVRV